MKNKQFKVMAIIKMYKKGNIVIVPSVSHAENHSPVHAIHSEATPFKTYAIAIVAGCGGRGTRPKDKVLKRQI